MQNILVNEESGIGYFPYINLDNGGGLTYVKEYIPDYFWVENLNDEEIQVNISRTGYPESITIQYSLDKNVWDSIETTQSSNYINIPPKKKMYFRGNGIWFGNSDSTKSYRFIIRGLCNIGGHIFTLTNYNGTDVTYAYALKNLFVGSLIVDASKLILAKEVNNNCYESMFNGCIYLTHAPKLPSTTLPNNCYNNMFQDCISLIQAPELPATTLADSCYQYMFSGCTSLVKAPELPATTLATYCYQYMFYGCTSLTQAPELPATILANYCYYNMFNGCTSLTQAPELPATTLATYCYRYMFNGCTSLTQAPELPATTLDNYCYGNMFKGCISLTQAPELPATTLAQYCYQNMFNGCTKLNYIKANFTTYVSNALTGWLSGVSSTGTFVKNPSATWTTTQVGIPNGWTIQNAS